MQNLIGKMNDLSSQTRKMKTDMALPNLSNPPKPPVVDGQSVPSVQKPSLPVMPQMAMPKVRSVKPLQPQVQRMQNPITSSYRPYTPRRTVAQSTISKMYQPIQNRIDFYKNRVNKYYPNIHV